MAIHARLLLPCLLAGCGLAFGPAAAQTIVTIGSGFSAPGGLAVDSSGNVFLADTGHNVVKEIFAATGFATGKTFGNGMGPPTGIAVDPAGNLFVVDTVDDTVKEILAAGGYMTVTTIGPKINGTPIEIALDSHENLFIGADTGVYELSAANGYATAQNLPGALSIGIPNGIAVDGNGNLFVASNDGVFELSASGGYVDANALGFGFDEPMGVAIDGAGNVFVADTRNNAVKEIPAAGGAIPTVLTLGSGFQHPKAVSVDGAGNVFVADQGDTSLKEILASGGYVTVQAIGSGFNRPQALTIDGGGNLFVADFGNNAIKEVPAAGGYSIVDTLSFGFLAPAAVAVDGHGNIFVADTADGAVKEITASSGFTTVTTLGSGIAEPSGIAVDGSGNVFVGDTADGAVKEILAAGGYTEIDTLAGGFTRPTGIAVDGSGDVFVANNTFIPFGDQTGPSTVEELLAIGGSIPKSPKMVALGSGFAQPMGLALDSRRNVVVADAGLSGVEEILAKTGYATVESIGSGFKAPSGVAVDTAGNIFVADTVTNAVKEILASPPVTLAAVLPGSRAVQIGTPATIFASMINSGPTALANCRISLPASAPAGLTLRYQTTDPATNALIGIPDTPVAIPGGNGLQTFVLAFQGNAAFSAPAMPLHFACDGVPPASVIPGVDTVDLTLSAAPAADIIALAATVSNDGIVKVPTGGTAAFAVASSNLGITAPITVSVDTGTAFLPVTATICQSDPSNGACLGTPAASVSLSDTGGSTPTFSVFVQSSGPVGFAPASSRVFVRFEDAAGTLQGSTSVAVATF